MRHRLTNEQAGSPLLHIFVALVFITIWALADVALYVPPTDIW